MPVVRPLARRFARSEPRRKAIVPAGAAVRRRAQDQLELAEAAGDIALRRAAPPLPRDWDPDPVRDDLMDYALAHLADPAGSRWSTRPAS